LDAEVVAIADAGAVDPRAPDAGGVHRAQLMGAAAAEAAGDLRGAGVGRPDREADARTHDVRAEEVVDTAMGALVVEVQVVVAQRRAGQVGAHRDATNSISSPTAASGQPTHS